MADRTVLVTDHYFDSVDVEEWLLDGVATVETLEDGARDHLDRQFAAADAVLTSRYPLDADRIAGLDRGRVISRYGIDGSPTPSMPCRPRRTVRGLAAMETVGIRVGGQNCSSRRPGSVA